MMPGEQSQVDEIIAGVKNGRISETTLNKSVKYVLKLISKSISNKDGNIMKLLTLLQMQHWHAVSLPKEWCS